MSDENMRHYLLTAMEAELLACYRSMDERAQVTIIALLASLVDGGCHKLDNPVEMRIVEK